MESSKKGTPSETTTTELKPIVKQELVTIEIEPIEPLHQEYCPTANEETVSINKNPVNNGILKKLLESKANAAGIELPTTTSKQSRQTHIQARNRQTRQVNNKHKKQVNENTVNKSHQVLTNTNNSDIKKIDAPSTELVSDRKMHMVEQVHTSENMFTCDVCKVQVGDKISLIKHLDVHTADEKFATYMCKRYTRKPTPEKDIHTYKNNYTCEICNKPFTKSSTLLRHSFTHSTKKPFTCEICEKQFTDKSNLMRHMQNHTNKRPYGCSMCEKKFTQVSSLKHHELTHTRKNEFVCGYCNKDFPFASHLERHERSHTKQKPFECKLCKKHFTEAFNLRRHERLHEAGKLQGKRVMKKKSAKVEKFVTVEIDPLPLQNQS